MPLFRRPPPPPPLTPQDPLSAHLQAIAKKRDGALGGLIRAMMAQDLWRAWRELPPGIEPHVRYVLTEPLDVTVAETTMPDGTPGVLVFSSEAAVRARHPAAVPVRMPGAQVLQPLLDSERFTGVVLDPAGPVVQLLLASWVREAVAGRL